MSQDPLRSPTPVDAPGTSGAVAPAAGAFGPPAGGAVASAAAAAVRAEERDLVDRAQAGDYDAFEALVIRHEGRVYTCAMRILRQREDAEDVVQTVFLKALEKIGDFRGDAMFSTWLMRVATNTALNVLRKKRGLPIAAPLEFDHEEPQLQVSDSVADWRERAWDALDRLELRSALERAIDVLPENYRLVFVLRDLEGLSVRDTAEVLGISEANVKVRTLRARLVLREQLSSVFGDPDRTARKPALIRHLESIPESSISAGAAAPSAPEIDSPSAPSTAAASPAPAPASRPHRSIN